MAEAPKAEPPAVAAPTPDDAPAPSAPVVGLDRPSPFPPAPLARRAPSAPGSAAAPGRAAPAQGLPPALAEVVPKLQLQVVVYSDTPSERLVFINNHKYVEGQMIEGRVLLERINADSAILSYEGTRFTLSRQ